MDTACLSIITAIPLSISTTLADSSKKLIRLTGDLNAEMV